MDSSSTPRPLRSKTLFSYVLLLTANANKRKQWILCPRVHFLGYRSPAEREGFEPSVRFPAHDISSVAHSTALAPLPNRRFAATGEQSVIVLACGMHRT